MSFIPPTIPTVVDSAATRARVDEINAKAERYARLHGGDDWQPELGPIRQKLRDLRAKVARRHGRI
jgi:hypothetical protein